ncbi:hypothetical protein AVEN_207088-1, partial [Araneus ventricosus]
MLLPGEVAISEYSEEDEISAEEDAISEEEEISDDEDAISEEEKSQE